MLSQTPVLPTLGNNPILLSMIKKPGYIAVTSMNLRRIRDAHGLNQAQLAVKIGSTPGRVSAYETGSDSMGTDYIERVCKALGDVELWQFFIEKDTPIISDREELRQVQIYRQAKQLGIEDRVMEQQEIWIEREMRKAGKTLTERADEEIRKVTETVNRRFGHLRKKKKTA